ncbi:creatininase family protein [Cohnella phaseoli]|uniref:Creatinine amidohydrolase n=1 Tax=Cohnella phaseoli TaxID=456490 RepID=A0A3D9KNJ0_9BACL|nr:creatininase family protein [Cohnella phaseoli]RED87545.1 creatinine amidohydrolase [Cohnella phaseoli]
MNSYLFHEHTREQLKRKAEAGSLVVVALAATEQHGPHLPVYTDSLITEAVAVRAAERASRTVPVLLCPLLTIGCSDHHLRFGGTLSFSSATYLHMLRDIGESLVADGFRKIAFLNGHGGNEPIMHQTASDLAVKHPVWTASASYWSLSREELRKENAEEVGMVPGHAGGFETSAVLALREGLVDSGRLATEHEQRAWINSGPPGAFIGRHGELTGADGYTDAPARATKERGERYVEAIVRSATAWLINIYETMERGEREARNRL